MGRLKQPEETRYFHFYNINPKGRRTTDCVYRAIATALNQTWEETLRDLMEYAIKYSLDPSDKKCFEKYLKDKGWEKQSAPRKGNTNKRYRAYEFGVEHQDEDMILSCGAQHLTFMSKGRIWDIWDCSEGSVGNFWIKKK